MRRYSYLLCTFLLSCLNSVPALPIVQDELILESDMRVTAEQWAHLVGNGTTRNVKRWPGYYWPQSTLVYSIGQRLSKHDLKASFDVSRITQSMSLISAQTCVRFRRTYNPWEPQVNIQRTDSGCWSAIGYLGRPQRLNLGEKCMSPGTIQHELLHSLAMVHMQNDPNRNRFVRINYENIIPGKEHNFDLYSASDVTDFGVGYDYDSLMHYGAYVFSRNGRPTIVPLQHDAQIGQNTLSNKDILKLNRMYC